MAEEPEDRIHLSAAQVAASSAAAVTAAVVCSLFGVAGTVIGTAVASVMATVGSAIYAHSLRRTKARLRRLHQAGAASPPLTEILKTARQQGNRLWGQMPVRALAIGAVGAFVASLAVVTVIELGIGEPLAALFGVGDSGSHRTSIGLGHRHSTSSKPAPTSTATSSSSSTSAPASTPATHPPTTTTTSHGVPTQSPPSNILSSVLSLSPSSSRSR